MSKIYKSHYDSNVPDSSNQLARETAQSQFTQERSSVKSENYNSAPDDKKSSLITYDEVSA